uniref:ZW10 C-terminal helical domain-containing protein n=1 Tax=Eutreptiella gymnastica TaxID=73025 RepID=A0A7S1JC64_9EUGL
MRPALGHTVHTAVVAVTHEVLRLQSIRPEEGQQLLDILDPLLLCEQWFMDFSVPVPTQADRQLLAQERLQRFVPGFTRFKSIVSLLSLSMSNVMAQWKGGLLQHFTTEELKGLLVALFPDSPQRRTSLKQLEQS